MVRRDPLVHRLPSATQDDWEWQYEGLCVTLDTDLFFAPFNERGEAKRVREQEAVQVCARCPVLVRCREHALTVREPYGVWGGLTEEDRARLPSLDAARADGDVENDGVGSVTSGG